MEATGNSSFLQTALIVLGAAAVVIPLFHRLRLSPVIGFMLVGAAVGPFGLGRLAVNDPWLQHFSVTDAGAIADVARLGVVLLMFMIGLELSFERLSSCRSSVCG